MPVLNRWWIAIAGVCLQMALGSAYAWSVFRIPLSKEFGWSITEVTWTFLISWFFLGCSTVVGGLWMKRKGPRVVAMVAGLFWGGGVFLASFSAHRLWWLYLTYGVIGGIGLGMGYIVPIAVLVKWFPDRRGLITGIAVAGFGAGALFSAPAAGWLILHVGLMPTFAYLGVAYAIVAIASGAFMQNPPEGWKPARLDAFCLADLAAIRPRLHARPGAGHLAMVGDLLPDVDQHDVGLVDRYPGVAHFSGDGKSHRGHRGRPGRRDGPGQRRRSNFLVLGLRLDHSENGVFHDVSRRGGVCSGRTTTFTRSRCWRSSRSSW